MTILGIILSGFVIGGLARWAVPGPDPMPIWLTALIGVAGSWIGGGIAAVFVGLDSTPSAGDAFVTILASIAASILLVIAYRRFVQKRPITGPEALEPPTRGVGIGKRRPRVGLGGLTPGLDRQAMLKKLDELHDAGVLTDEEYVERRREVLRQH